jgi:hypothetical protein
MCERTLFIQMNEGRIRGGWYSDRVKLDSGREIEYKGYGTWLQVFKIDGVDYSNAHEQGVREWKEYVQSKLQ